MKLTGSQILIETLIEQGTEVVFGYPGGAVLNIYDDLYLNAHRIRHVISAHEQGAAHAADGYARATGKTGVVLATSGPGATNLVTGIATAHLDSVPMVAITGNVACSLLGRDSFQEVDIVGITLPITKHNYMVKDVADLADTIREAFQIAQSGRPGPVLIDIPKDVQINTAEFIPQAACTPVLPAPVEEADLVRAVELIQNSKRPYIYCGGGVLRSGAGAQVMALAEKLDAPIGFSMMGLSAVPSDFPLSLGMTGMHGSYVASKAKTEADLILALGVRFSDRATGDKSKYAAGAKVIHVDIDDAELDKNIAAHLGLLGDVKEVLDRLLVLISEKKKPEWLARIAEMQQYAAAHSGMPLGELSPFGVIDAVSRRTEKDTPVATDVGQHQMWVAQRYPFASPRTLISSGGLGTMGFGLGAAIGACIATGKRTVLFTGDGSFGMNLNELATAVSQKLPVVIVILNNGVLGMVRQWQTAFYQKHYSQTTLERKTNFAALAEAFGARGLAAATPEELERCLDAAFSVNGPVVIDCAIDKDERVLPMIPPNCSVEQIILN